MKKRKIIYLFFIFLSVNFCLQAQNEDSNTINQGDLLIHQDSRIDDLLELDKNKSSLNYNFKGYRIQIFSGRSTQKDKALEAKYIFLELFPNQRAYIIYKAPDFRVRVGNFRSQFECVELYNKLKGFFPKAYIVKTNIPISSLKLSDIDKKEEDSSIEE